MYDQNIYCKLYIFQVESSSVSSVPRIKVDLFIVNTIESDGKVY